MSELDKDSDGLILSGLDGSNPLAFLAALGTLRALTEASADRKAKLGWTPRAGGWRPVLHSGETSQNEIIAALTSFLRYRSTTPSKTVVRHHRRAMCGSDALDRADKCWRRSGLTAADRKVRKKEFVQLIERSRYEWLSLSHPYLLLGKDTNLRGEEFRQRVLEHIANKTATRFTLDQFAALGSDITDDNGVMFDSALRTMSGSGHQHQLEFMGNLLEQVTPQSIRRSLFDAWDYADGVRSLTLRLDPIDDSRYALQWGNPSTDPTRDESGSMLGANALAVIGFSLLPTVSLSEGLATVGFTGRGSRDTFWTWPIWDQPISVDIVRSILTLQELMTVSHGGSLHLRGVSLAYRSQRLTVGKFRNFAPAHRVA